MATKTKEETAEETTAPASAARIPEGLNLNLPTYLAVNKDTGKVSLVQARNEREARTHYFNWVAKPDQPVPLASGADEEEHEDVTAFYQGNKYEFVSELDVIQ